MNLKLTRRQFGQLAIAGTAATVFGYLANRTFAQTPNQVIGVSLGPILDTDNTATPEVDSTDDTDTTTETITNREIVLQSLNLDNGEIQTLTTSRVLVQSNERLTGFTSLSSTYVVAIAPVSTSNKGDGPTRLVFLSDPVKTLTIAGLKKENQLASLTGTNDGKLIGLVVKKNGRPPTRIGEVNLQTGDINFFDQVVLPQDRQVSNLVQCPDGNLYVTALSNKGEAELVQLDLGKGKSDVQVQLKVNDTDWNSGLASLVCSSTGQLLVFGAPRYISPNRVYVLDASTGTLSPQTSFNAIEITIPRG